MTKTVGAFSLILFLFLVNDTQAVLVDRILAVVNHQPITLSDLHQHEAFLALNTGKKNWAPSDTFSSTSLQQIIDQRLLLEEAGRFEVSAPDKTDLLKVQDRLAKQFASPEEFQDTLRRWGLNREDLRQLLEHQLTVERFVDQRIKFFVIIPPAEIQTYYESHREEYRGTNLEQALAQITSKLTDQKTEEKLEAYLKKLRENASIQINP
jgi:peptidyl-prolyl cis-trans isomerase SurA